MAFWKRTKSNFYSSVYFLSQDPSPSCKQTSMAWTHLQWKSKDRWFCTCGCFEKEFIINYVVLCCPVVLVGEWLCCDLTLKKKEPKTIYLGDILLKTKALTLVFIFFWRMQRCPPIPVLGIEHRSSPTWYPSTCTTELYFQSFFFFYPELGSHISQADFSLCNWGWPWTTDPLVSTMQVLGL